MNAGKIMVEVTRLKAAVKCREDMHGFLDRRWRQSQELTVEEARRRCDEADKEIAAALVSLRGLAKDNRFAAFSDDELLVAALKFVALYHRGWDLDFASDGLGELICPKQPERLASLVEALFIKRTSPLNDCLEVEVQERCNNFSLEPKPDKLNALFVADGGTP